MIKKKKRRGYKNNMGLRVYYTNYGIEFALKGFLLSMLTDLPTAERDRQHYLIRNN